MYVFLTCLIILFFKTNDPFTIARFISTYLDLQIPSEIKQLVCQEQETEKREEARLGKRRNRKRRNREREESEA